MGLTPAVCQVLCQHDDLCFGHIPQFKRWRARAVAQRL